MKKICTIISTLLLVFAFTNAIAQPIKTLVKSFNLEGNTTVSLDLKGAVEVQNWDRDILQIQIEIYNEQFNGRIVKSLIAAGRYNLKGISSEAVFVVNAPALKKSVKIRGTLLEDKVKFIVFAPNNVDVNISIPELESSLSEVTKTIETP